MDFLTHASFRNCLALRNLNALGPDGYHWRVRIDEKPNTSHSSNAPTSSSSAIPYSWWDVQDESARLPVKEATPKELKRMFSAPNPVDGDVVTQEVTKAAKGAMKYMGKAMNAVAGSTGASEEEFNAIRTPVICFKLLDLEKMRSEFGGARGGGRGRMPAARPAARRNNTRSSSNVSQASSQARPQVAQPNQPQQRRVSAPVSAGAPRIQPTSQQQRPSAPVPKSTTPTADLMGFGAPTAPAAGRTLHHAASMPSGTSRNGATSTPTGALPNESRAEKLKREYAQKAASTNRVWDDIDQRWVEGPVKNGETTKAAATPSGASSSASSVNEAATSLKGISLSTANAVGKSSSVQAAVHARVADMEQSQQKAINELRERESKKQNADAEEDIVRQRLDPKLKAWSEEHGKKKQLRALLANLHTILWEGSGWKPISLADVLDDSKVKRVYHKASRVVHPDKTGHLDAEKRFIAKRVFDSLTQAKTDFDEGAK